MRLPAPLSRHNPHAHKHSFGHVLIIAGSSRMLGAGALSALAAMRSGAGLVTLAVPQSLNLTVQKKISPVIMTWPLKETARRSFSLTAFPDIKKRFTTFHAIALGPGISQDPSTQKLIHRIISSSPVPLIIDADGLNALSNNIDLLTKTSAPKILTPHVGEMARLTGLSKSTIEADRIKITTRFCNEHVCTVLLKGNKTLVVAPGKKPYINTTGNAGMATAGSGDVLTGMIAGLVAQGIEPFTATQTSAFLHGRAGDLAAKDKGRASLIATDMIDQIPNAFKKTTK